MVGGWTDIFRTYVRRRLVLAVCVVIVFVAGIVTGGLALQFVADEGRAALVEEVQSLLRFVDSRPAAAPADVLKVALGEYVLKVPFVIGLLGLSVIGAPIVLAVIFVRGFVLGFTTMFLIDGLFLRGVVLAAAALLPQNLLAVPATVIAGIAALSFSTAAARVLLGRRDINMYQQFASAAVVLLLSAVTLIGAAFVEAYVSPVLMSTASRFFM